MTTFLDGPLKGVVLSLRRAPKFLRATRKAVAGKFEFDALDQIADTPRPGESLHCYYLVADDGWIHIDGRTGPKGGRRFGETLRRATYAFYHLQPDDATMRDNNLWRAWCLAEDAKALPRE